MAHEAVPIDASSMPDVCRLVREVTRTGQPRLLTVNGETALLTPAPATRRRTFLTPAEREELLRATFGAWKGLVDPV